MEQKLQHRLIILLPYLWLLLLFLAPFGIVLKISLSDTAIAIPPYLPLWDWHNIRGFFTELDAENYVWIFDDNLYWKSYLSSLRIAAISTLITLLIGYPMAYALAKAPAGIRPTLLMLVILPFWTSFLIRVYAWIGILKNEGYINIALQWLGVIDEPIVMLNTDFAVFVGIVYSYLPFMILPLYATLEKMNESLVEAAKDLGCTEAKAFWKITLPLSIPGIIAGCFLVFIPAIGEFVIPDLLGGSDNIMIGKTLWNEFFRNRDWPVASAVAVLLLLLLIIPILLFQHFQERTKK